MQAHFAWHNSKLVLYCTVQPNAQRDEIIGLHGGRLKIRLHAPPAGGAANLRLIKFLAGAFAVGITKVEIRKGAVSRQKTVVIDSPKVLPEKFALNKIIS